MRILIDARMYGLENSGIGRYIINLTDELKKLKIEEKFDVLLRKKYFDRLKFPENWKKILADFRHYTFEEQFKLPSIIKKENPDLVHFPHINYPIFYKGKHVITVHDLTMQKQGVNATTLPLPIYYLKRIPFLLAARVGIKTADAIFTPSEVVKDDVSDYYGVDKSKIHVTYEAMSVVTTNHNSQTNNHNFRRWNLEKERYFFYVGNAYPHKNLELVVKAIKKLNEESGLNIKFAIAGSKDVFVERLQEMVEKEHVQKFVKILGYVSEEELHTLYKNSLAFVYPSLSEGFGLQGLEAMASGTVVLASDIPVFREIYKDNALYFDPKDVNSLIELMKSSMKMSRQKRLQMIDEAKKFIGKYSWQRMAKETLSVYRKVFYAK